MRKQMFFMALPVVLLLSFSQLLGAQFTEESQEPVLVSRSDRPVVFSPDGRWHVTVWGDTGELPWLMLESRGEVRIRFQLWHIERFGYVLWRSDSKAIAFTDALYSNHWFVRVFLTEGQRQARGYIDVSALFEKRFERYLRKRRREAYQVYAKALRWLRDGQLLVGVHAWAADPRVVAKHAPVDDWRRGYIIDVEKKRITRELEEAALEKLVPINRDSWDW